MTIGNHLKQLLMGKNKLIKRMDVTNSRDFRVESSELCDEILSGFADIGIDIVSITSHEDLILRILRHVAGQHTLID